MKKKYEILFQPMKIGKLEIKNRFVMAPMGPGGLCDADGTYNERGVEYYVERAKGGTGLIITGVTMVENDIEKCALPSMPCPTLNPLNFVKTGKIMTERVHAYGAKMFLQLSAGFGRVSIPSIVGKTAVAPSPIPHRWLDGVTCRALTIEEIQTYITKFAQSAVIAKKAGFDGIEIHAVHEGYLLDQFAISFFNNRTDEYGGSLRNRLRFAIEVVQAIKEACGQDYPVSLRYSIKSFIKDWRQGGLPGEDFDEKGRDIEEGIEAAKILEEAGYDAFNGDVGSYDSWYWSHPPMYQKKGMYLEYNEILKKVLKVPVITAGRMEDPELASESILQGKTDMIALGRPLLADAEIPNKIMADKFDKVRPCLSCQEGCMGRLATYATVSCAVNPACGRENEYGISSARKIKKVVIIGGGVAGCEAARVCTLRGHKVTLLEKSDRLGGNIIAGGVPDFKDDDRALAKWYTDELKDLEVDIHFNTEATKEIITNLKSDVVIVATGSTPRILNIDNSSKVYSAEDVLLGRKDAGNNVVIIGGGLVGCEAALWLADQGKKVTIVEMQSDILKVGGPLCHANEDMLRDLVNFKKIDLKFNTMVASATNEGFILKSGEKEEAIKADCAIVAIGYNSQKSLYDELKFKVPEVHLLGDARQVQNIMYAIWDAYEVSRNI
ncbi:FAD-dependent oxidoreductase [Clostridium estertheticum]|uniref:FAD-dependent oxidoreductase n=1 Tax=Clostridium estertheticum TaxID=238834 RepID=UPI001C6E03D8|nr:FAD-dependent oxidoreductase [Clostridium estertheticum]MBW9171369.1 FAD-dependent oxidoreductase [Clostridium estertheticum]WLC76716.1 FAD-dependent oxidoreductase [Clostridium estertheticum]